MESHTVDNHGHETTVVPAPAKLETGIYFGRHANVLMTTESPSAVPRLHDLDRHPADHPHLGHPLLGASSHNKSVLRSRITFKSG
jgi:hypothetical protein